MRIRSILASLTLAAAAATAPVLATPASASCAPPDGMYTYYSITSPYRAYTGTNVASTWATFRYGGTINYTTSKTATLDASVTATVSAEAGVIFASASTSLGVTVGKSWSKSSSWSYTANIPADSKHMYRVHLYHYSVNFTVTKRHWYPSTCSYHVMSGYPSRVYHAPAAGNKVVFRVDKAAA